MSSKKSRTELIATLNQLVRDNGNTNVLLVHAIAQHVGLSASEFECCGLIHDHGPFTAGELAQRCHITTGGMTGMIDRLEKAGFVKRSIDPSDRRRVLVTAVMADEAIDKITTLYTPLQNAFDEVMARYSDDQIALLVDFFDKANAMFNATIAQLPEK